MKKQILLIAVLGMFVAGCQFNWLVSNKFHGTDRTVKEFFATTQQVGDIGQEKSSDYYDYTIRVCNVDDNGNLGQCMDTVVVQYVIQDARYGVYQNR